MGVSEARRLTDALGKNNHSFVLLTLSAPLTVTEARPPPESLKSTGAHGRLNSNAHAAHPSFFCPGNSLHDLNPGTGLMTQLLNPRALFSDYQTDLQQEAGFNEVSSHLHHMRQPFSLTLIKA